MSERRKPHMIDSWRSRNANNQLIDKKRQSARQSAREGEHRRSVREERRQNTFEERRRSTVEEPRRSTAEERRYRVREGERRRSVRERRIRSGREEESSLSIPKEQRRRVDALDGLRALCALAVIAYHMGIKWMSGGLLGVTILFVLSGYLATDSIVQEFTRNKGQVAIGRYYLRRIRRLMPQAAMCVVVTAALCTLFNHVLLTKMRPDVLPSLCMVLNWSKILTKASYFAAAGVPSPLTHFWSLAIEWQFFLIWPPALYVMLRLHIPRRYIRALLVVLALLSAVGMAWLYTPNADPSRSYYGTDTRAMSLFLGCWLALKFPLRQASTLVLEGKARLQAEGVGLLALVALIIMMVVTEGYTSFSYYGGVALVSIISAIAIAALLLPDTLLSQFLGLAPFVWLGQRAYALYLWHYPIILLVSKPNATSAIPWWLYVVQLALTLVVSDVTFRFIEKPFGKAGMLPQMFAGFIAAVREQGACALRSRAQVLVPSAAIILIAVGGLMFVPAADAAGGKPGDNRVAAASLRTPTKDGIYDVVLVGDSVPLGAYDQIAAIFPMGLIDCKISRQMSAGIEVLQSYIDQGVVGDTVVSCLGSNGPLNQEILDELLATVGDKRTLWIVNNRMPDNWQDANNALIKQFADVHDNVHLIDWFGYSKGHDDWLWQDGEHVQPAGAEAYAQMLKTTMNYEIPTKENTTYSTLVLGDTVAMDAVDELSAAFPTGAVDCAEGRGSQDAYKKILSYLKQKVIGQRVVLAVGTESALRKTDLDEIIDALGSDREIWLVNTRSQGQWQDNNNTLLKAVADKHNNVQLIDWFAASTNHDEYFSGDGVNLSKKGAAAYAQLVADAVSESEESSNGAESAAGSDAAEDTPDSENAEASAPSEDAESENAEGTAD